MHPTKEQDNNQVFKYVKYKRQIKIVYREKISIEYIYNEY